MKGEPMEKSRAIELLEHLAWDRNIDRNPYGDALNIAIEALKAQSQEDTTSDTISRQAAIDALDKRFDSIPMEQTAEILKLRKDLRELPPVQPEPCEDAISRQAARHALCKAVHKDEDIPCDNQTASCLWTGTRVCDYVREIDALPSVQPNLQPTCNRLTTDTISRQAAIDRFNVIRPVDPKKDEYTKGIDVGIAMCIVAVKDQPSAQPESGRWIYTPGMNEQCSACGQYFPLSYFKDRPFDIKYCPHCGAYMRGEKDE